MATIIAVLRTDAQNKGITSSMQGVLQIFSTYGEVQAIDMSLALFDRIVEVTYYDVRDAQQAVAYSRAHPAVEQCTWKQGCGAEQRSVSLPAAPISWSLRELREFADRFGEVETLQFGREEMNVVFFSSIAARRATQAIKTAFENRPELATPAAPRSDRQVPRGFDVQQARQWQGSQSHDSHDMRMVRQEPDFFVDGAPGLSQQRAPVSDPMNCMDLPVDHSDKEDLESEMFAINIEAIRAGKDKRTTCMVRNIPNRYTQRLLTETIEKLLPNVAFDFLYVPLNVHNRRNVGYAFMNFVDPTHIVPFYEAFHGSGWSKFNSEKICAVVYARIQGLGELREHFRARCSVGRKKQPLFRFSASHSGMNPGSRQAELDLDEEELSPFQPMPRGNGRVCPPEVHPSNFQMLDHVNMHDSKFPAQQQYRGATRGQQQWRQGPGLFADSNLGPTASSNFSCALDQGSVQWISEFLNEELPSTCSGDLTPPLDFSAGSSE